MSRLVDEVSRNTSIADWENVLRSIRTIEILMACKWTAPLLYEQKMRQKFRNFVIFQFMYRIIVHAVATFA